MGLIKCPMCGKEISPNAVTCPNCGEPLHNNKDNLVYKVVLDGKIKDSINLIKIIREFTEIGIIEAKNLIDNLPSQIAECNTRTEAEKIKSIIINLEPSTKIEIIEDICKPNLQRTEDNKVLNNDSIKLLYKVIIESIPSNVSVSDVIQILKNELMDVELKNIENEIKKLPYIIDNISYPCASRIKKALIEQKAEARIEAIRYSPKTIETCTRKTGKYIQQTTISDIIEKNMGISNELENKVKNQIYCPNCKGTNTSKISLTSRATGILSFGIFSSNIGKTWKCKSCGYKW